MLKNYLSVALRNLKKNKIYVAINAFGLGIAIACCITAYILIAYNIEFDSFHQNEKVSHIFRIYTHTEDKSGSPSFDAQAPLMLGHEASKEIAGIEGYTRYLTGSGSMRYSDKVFNERISFADSTFFDFF